MTSVCRRYRPCRHPCEGLGATRHRAGCGAGCLRSALLSGCAHKLARQCEHCFLTVEPESRPSVPFPVELQQDSSRGGVAGRVNAETKTLRVCVRLCDFWVGGVATDGARAGKQRTEATFLTKGMDPGYSVLC